MAAPRPYQSSAAIEDFAPGAYLGNRLTVQRRLVSSCNNEKLWYNACALGPHRLVA